MTSSRLRVSSYQTFKVHVLALVCVSGVVAPTASATPPVEEATPATKEIDKEELAVPQAAQARRFKLANGLEVQLQIDRARPRVGIALSVRAGFGDDPSGYSGLAHLTEHCLYEGSAHTKPGEYFRIHAQLGATHLEAFTGAAHTSYSAEVPTGSLARALWLEAERAALVLDGLEQAGLARALEAVLDEASVRWLQSDVLSRLYTALYGPDHPFARLESRDVEHIGLDHVRWFVQHHYRPDNAKLVLVGNFELEAAERMIRATFDAWKSHAGSPKSPRRDLPLLLRASVTRVQSERGALRRQIGIAWPVDRVNRRGAQSLAMAAAALTTVLRTAGFSRFAVQFENDEPHYPSAFWVYVTLPIEQSFADGSASIERAVAGICSGDEDRLLRELLAGTRLSHALERDNYAVRAIRLARREEDDAASSQEPSAEALSVEEVRANCRRWLGTKPRAELHLGPLESESQ